MLTILIMALDLTFSFLFEAPGVVRVQQVSLNNNNIGKAVFQQLNYAILALDLSYNAMELSDNVISFLTPLTRCVCQYQQSMICMISLGSSLMYRLVIQSPLAQF